MGMMLLSPGLKCARLWDWTSCWSHQGALFGYVALSMEGMEVYLLEHEVEVLFVQVGGVFVSVLQLYVKLRFV